MSGEAMMFLIVFMTVITWFGVMISLHDIRDIRKDILRLRNDIAKDAGRVKDK